MIKVLPYYFSLDTRYFIVPYSWWNQYKIQRYLSTIIWFNVGCRSSSITDSGKNLKSSSITSGSSLNYKNVPPFLKQVKLVSPHMFYFQLSLLFKVRHLPILQNFLVLQVNFISEAITTSSPHLSPLGYFINFLSYYC